MWKGLPTVRLCVGFCFAVATGVFLVGCANREIRRSAEAANVNLANEPVAFYGVPLVCPAAPQIGCGSRAKPILRHLDAGAEIREAWLNRAGTQMAVVWEEPGSPKSRQRTLNSLLTRWDLTASELSGDARVQAAKQFASQAGWYRADGLDQLSEEEAGLIATRLVRRIQAKAPLSEEKIQAMQAAMTNTLKQRLLGLAEQPARSADEERQAFLQKAAEYLNEAELAALRDAIALGFRPLPGES